MSEELKNEEVKTEEIKTEKTGEKQLAEEELTKKEEHDKWLVDCFEELKSAGEEFAKLGMKVTVHDVSEENFVPVLVIALRELGRELLAVDLSFSSFERESLEETKWLQIGVEFPWDVPNRDHQRFIGLLNKINAYLPVGHFSLIDEVLFYRFVCSIPKNMKASDMPVLESISVISMFAANYEEIFRSYLTKKITFNELYDMITQTL